MGDYDPDDCLAEETTSRNVCVFLVATYTDGQPTESAAWFCKWLQEAAHDFRFGKTHLKGLRYAVFGLGNSVYVDHYNTVSICSAPFLSFCYSERLSFPKCSKTEQ
ncbi:hypothetical protein AV530_011162 [Patagioenas fasciata monilis]|uniref:Flavodoxin-like domain-containing protein n=1 Tax=Patagioenas fasciata monilis TaxID=372326 RepID=A0A1V4L116_PATFA|nr:hypothetical protein AV530_011162 [Patagioenas fasciata monilis]